MRLCELFPNPVPVVIAGIALPVWPLRIRDLATIETWMSRRLPDPFEAGRAWLESVDEEDRPVVAAVLYERCERAAPVFGSPECQEILASPEGTAALLTCVLRSGAELDLATIRVLAEYFCVDREAREQLDSAAYGVSSLEKLMVTLEGPPDPSTGPFNWGEALYYLCVETGLDLEKVGDMSLKQWVALRSEGKAGSDCLPRSGETRQQASQRRSNVFAKAREVEAELQELKRAN